MQNLIPACAYIRVSSKQQVELGYSLDEQRESIEKYCKSNGCQLVDVYTDAGVSGRKVHRREFNLMLDAIKANRYGVLIVWRLDRAARRPSIGYKLKDALESTDTEIISITEPYISNRFMYGIVLAMAEEEYEKKSERAKIGAVGRAKMGKLSGRLKYGFKLGPDGRPAIDENEAQIVQRIFGEYSSDLGTTQIVDGLHADGISTRHDSTWTPEAVIKLIKSEEYTGKGYVMKRHSKIIDNGEKDVSHTMWRDKSEWIPVEYPSLIDEATWNKAQEIRRRNAGLRASKGYTLNFPLRHLVWCESCGSRFVPTSTKMHSRYVRKDGSVHHSVSEKRWRGYACRVGRNGRNGCVRPRIGAVKLETIVWNEVKRVIEHPETVRAVVEERRAEFERTGTLCEIEKKKRQLVKVKEEGQRAITAFTKGYLDEDELDIRMKSVNERREMYEYDLERIGSEVGDYDSQLALLDDFMAVAEHVRGRIPTLSEDDKAELIDVLVNRITTGESINVEMVLTSAPVTEKSAPWR